MIVKGLYFSWECSLVGAQRVSVMMARCLNGFQHVLGYNIDNMTLVVVYPCKRAK